MLTLSGRVSETQQVLANQTTFRLRTPDLIISVGSLRFSTVALTAPDHKTDLLRLSTFLAARGRSCRGQGDGSQDYLHQPAASHAEGSGVPCGGPGSAERPWGGCGVSAKNSCSKLLHLYLLHTRVLTSSFTLSVMSVVLPRWLWQSISSPPSPDPGSWWHRSTASSSRKCTEWPTSLSRRNEKETSAAHNLLLIELTPSSQRKERKLM